MQDEVIARMYDNATACQVLKLSCPEISLQKNKTLNQGYESYGI
jgi:hypothetical protein